MRAAGWRAAPPHAAAGPHAHAATSRRAAPWPPQTELPLGAPTPGGRARPSPAPRPSATGPRGHRPSEPGGGAAVAAPPPGTQTPQEPQPADRRAHNAWAETRVGSEETGRAPILQRGSSSTTPPPPRANATPHGPELAPPRLTARAPLPGTKHTPHRAPGRLSPDAEAAASHQSPRGPCSRTAVPRRRRTAVREDASQWKEHVETFTVSLCELQTQNHLRERRAGRVGLHCWTELSAGRDSRDGDPPQSSLPRLLGTPPATARAANSPKKSNENGSLPPKKSLNTSSGFRNVKPKSLNGLSKWIPPARAQRAVSAAGCSPPACQAHRPPGPWATPALEA